MSNQVSFYGQYVKHIWSKARYQSRFYLRLSNLFRRFFFFFFITWADFDDSCFGVIQKIAIDIYSSPPFLGQKWESCEKKLPKQVCSDPNNILSHHIPCKAVGTLKIADFQNGEFFLIFRLLKIHIIPVPQELSMILMFCKKEKHTS